MREPQTTDSVLMVRPARFAGNPQTAPSNAFQRLHTIESAEDVHSRALDEFDSLAAELRAAGVSVYEFADLPEPHTPDAIFPNNWVSFHADGTVVLYPMMALNRRLERRPEIIEALEKNHCFRVDRIIDFSRWERQGRFLEGTGSLVLDRINRIAYTCRSPRTDPELLGEFASSLGYEIVTFEAFDHGGVPVYHTNVVMSLGSRFSAVCADAIPAPQRKEVLNMLLAGGREILFLSFAQMASFAGNMLELQGAQGAVVAMSASAYESLEDGQRRQLMHAGLKVVAAAVPTIERAGGGSVRCMIAEIHLPRVVR